MSSDALVPPGARADVPRVRLP